MPRPPTLIATMMITWPSPDQYVAVSTVVRPVTQTADAAVNNASTNGARWPDAVACGRDSSAENSPMTRANTDRARRAGTAGRLVQPPPQPARGGAAPGAAPPPARTSP